jgi:hypothetical protein
MFVWSKVLHAERSGLWLRLRRAVGRRYAACRDRRWRSIEIGIGVFVLAFLCTEAPRAMIRVWLTVAFYAMTSLVPLLRVDGAATAWSLALGLGRIGLAAFHPCS